MASQRKPHSKRNEHIRAETIRLVDPKGEMIGIVKLEEGLRQASEVSLDLVEISPNADPPVCKIMDFGKFKFDQKRREREAKKVQKAPQLKEMQFRPKISGHDFDFKVRKIESFLDHGDKVKATVILRGREVAFVDQAEDVLNRILERLAEVAHLESAIRREGHRRLTMTIAPKKGRKK